VTVFFLCGLWHGASWNFVLWGLFHGTFLVLERLGLARLVQRTWRPLRHAYTLAVVMVGWVLFRAETLPDAVAFLAAMAGRAATAPTPFTVIWYLTPALWLTLAAGAIGSFPIGPSLTRLTERAAATFGSREADGFGATGLSAPSATELGAFLQGRTAFNTAGVAFLGLVLIASIVQIAARTYNPFIYFRF
jgi:alginate O-acetyltransferase complex protein AlgI